MISGCALACLPISSLISYRELTEAVRDAVIPPSVNAGLDPSIHSSMSILFGEDSPPARRLDPRVNPRMTITYADPPANGAVPHTLSHCGRTAPKVVTHPCPACRPSRRTRGTAGDDPGLVLFLAHTLTHASANCARALSRPPARACYKSAMRWRQCRAWWLMSGVLPIIARRG